jgi:hypothetical protein
MKCPDCNDTGYITLLTSRKACGCRQPLLVACGMTPFSSTDPNGTYVAVKYKFEIRGEEGPISGAALRIWDHETKDWKYERRSDVFDPPADFVNDSSFNGLKR